MPSHLALLRTVLKDLRGNSSSKPGPQAAICLTKELPTLPKNLANKWIFIKLSSLFKVYIFFSNLYT